RERDEGRLAVVAGRGDALDEVLARADADDLAGLELACVAPAVADRGRGFGLASQVSSERGEQRSSLVARGWNVELLARRVEFLRGELGDQSFEICCANERFGQGVRVGGGIDGGLEILGQTQQP